MDGEAVFGQKGSRTVLCGQARLCGRSWFPGGPLAEARGPDSGRTLGGSVVAGAEGQGQRWAAKHGPAGGVGWGRLRGLREPRGWDQPACGFGGLGVWLREVRAISHTGGLGLNGVGSPGEGWRPHLALLGTSGTRGGRTQCGAHGLGVAKEKVWVAISSRVSMWQWLSGRCFSVGGKGWGHEPGLRARSLCAPFPPDLCHRWWVLAQSLLCLTSFPRGIWGAREVGAHNQQILND